MLRSFLTGAVLALGALGCSDGDDPALASSGNKERVLGPPVVIPDVECDFDADPLNKTYPLVNIGGRDVVVDYPCNKPSGSAVTFVLVLHGTQSIQALKNYLRSYIGSAKYVDSHSFIVATPMAIGSQWGRGDDGQDEPHILEVVDWMYDTFKGFDIVNMWVAGHSWGSVYTLGFVCKPELEDKVTGAVLMSGSSPIPACADRLALIGTVGETDIVPGELAQADVAAAHGCGPQRTTEITRDVLTEWPDCSAGFVHQSYLMLGKGHGFDPIDWPDEDMRLSIADAMVKVRGE
jgi:hypothetical protein